MSGHDIVGKRIFVTGGAGFIGSTLAAELVDRNQVVAYDNLSRNALSGAAIRSHENFELIEGDILDRDHLQQAMLGADIVVHCAAIAGIDTVIKEPVATMQVNMLGSSNVLAAAASLDPCERVICFSTSEVFGSSAFQSSEEDGSVIGEVGEARWTYAVSKLAEEHLAIAYFHQMGLPATVIRPFNVYGPNQVGEGALKIFIERALRNEPIQIHGDGSQIRAWVYVDDMVDAVMRAMVRPEAIGESFNIGNNRAVLTIYGLAKMVVQVLGSDSEIVFVPREHADVELRVPDVSKARNLLDFEAQVDIEDGIARTAAGMRERLGL
jgi:UDP-glucose 4-epimerase